MSAVLAGNAASFSRSKKPLAPRGIARPRLGAWAGFWLTALIVVFASKCVWYDCRIIFDWMRGDGLRTVFIIYTLALVPFLGLAAVAGIHHLTKTWTMVLFVWIGVQGLLCAALHEQLSDPYVLNDLVKLSFVPAGFIWVWFDPPRSFDLFLRRVAHAILAYQGLKLVIYVLYYHGHFSFYYGEIIDLFPLCYFLSKYCRERPDVAERYLAWTLLAAVIVLLGQRRTVLAGGCVIAAYIGIRSYFHLLGRPSIYVLGLIAVASLFVASGLWIEVSERFLQRIVATDVGASIGEGSTRFREVELVVDQVFEERWQTKLFGFGHGATFEDEVANRDTGEFVKHSVHFTPAAMLLRYGLIGLFFFAALIAALTFAKEVEIDGWIGTPNYLAMKSFGLAAAVGSLTLYGLMDDLMVGAFLGGCCWARAYATQASRGKEKPKRSEAPLAEVPSEPSPRATTDRTASVRSDRASKVAQRPAVVRRRAA